MLITALVLTLVGFLRRRPRGTAGDEATGVPARENRLERVGEALRRAADRLVREPGPAVSAVVAVVGLAVVGTHLACSGQV